MTAQAVHDPYAPPGAIVADPAPASYGDFRRISTWWIVPLSIITLWVYPSYWLYSRVKTLNALSRTDAIPEGLPLAGLLFTCVGVPTYRNTAGGRPGKPVSVLTPTAGETPTT